MRFTWEDLKRQMDKAAAELAARPQWQQDAIRADVRRTADQK